DVAEVLRHGEGRQPHPQPDTGWLVHLAVDQGTALDDPRLLHLEPQVVALTGAFPDAGEHRDAAVLAGHPGDHLQDEHGLADARPTGTRMPWPRLRTGAPRLRPSVGFMAMARTRLSPMCWATSATTVFVRPSTSMSNSTAKLISGRALGGNSTSTTGPTMATI